MFVKLGGRGVKFRVIVVFVVISVVPIAAVSLFSYTSARNSIYDQYRSMLQQETANSAARLDMLLFSLKSYADSVTADTTVLAFLLNPSEDSPDSEAAIGQIKNYGRNIGFPVNIVLFAKNGVTANSYLYPRKEVDKGIQLMLQDEWFQKSDRLSVDFQFIGMKAPYIRGFESGYHYYFRRNFVDKNNGYLGTLVFDVSNYSIDRLISDSVGNLNTVACLRNGDEVLFSTAATDMDFSEPLRALGNDTRSITSMEWHGERKLVACARLINGWVFIKILDEKAMFGSIGMISTAATVVVIMLAVLSSILYLVIERSIIHPLIAVEKAMKQAQAGDFNISVSVNSNDELGQLADGFNRMVADIHGLFERVKIEQKHAREFEFAMLQAQISPHFLYNTLNCIRWMADIADASHISGAILRLVGLLQYSISDVASRTTLREEAQYIENYVALNNLRFNSKFELTCKIAPELDDITVIKFIIQPLVENAIIHGLGEKPGKGHILLTASCENKKLVLHVVDDGVGMDAGHFERTLSAEQSDKENHIGLKNINERIRLQYGEGYGLSLEESLAGTDIVVILPLEE